MVREEKNGNITEKVLLAYFVQRSEKLKSPGSLWAEYSMLKTTMFLHDSVDISKYALLIPFLKRKNIGYRLKISKVLTKEAKVKFLTEGPDDKFLTQKFAMIFGVVGACRREELYKMTITDIEDHGSLIIVKIPNTKTNIWRTFTITNKENENIHYQEIYRKYAKIRLENAKFQRLFLTFRNGKCTNQVVGNNTIGS